MMVRFNAKSYKRSENIVRSHRQFWLIRRKYQNAMFEHWKHKATPILLLHWSFGSVKSLISPWMI